MSPYSARPGSSLPTYVDRGFLFAVIPMASGAIQNFHAKRTVPTVAAVCTHDTWPRKHGKSPNRWQRSAPARQEQRAAERGLRSARAAKLRF